uniref:Defective in cullin neddylation protein n=1 Tax=Tabanus bromius TaxID=304241 RepID=A0A0K8TPA6_TABBR
MGKCVSCCKREPCSSIKSNCSINQTRTVTFAGRSEVNPQDEKAGLLSRGDSLSNKLNSVENKNRVKPIVLTNGDTNGVRLLVKTVRGSQQLSDNTLNLLFEKYRDTKEDVILSDGIERLCKDLGYAPDDFAILVLAWNLDASQMCRFTKSEFIKGLEYMNADTIQTIRIRLEQMIENLKTDAEKFKQLYRFTFRFGLEPENRILSVDMAIILWRLVFTVCTPTILEQWLHFLEQNPGIRGIPKDTWNMFLNFAESFDINQYDDTEAWPSLFDDFVDYEKCKSISNFTKDHTGSVHCSWNNVL